MKVWLCVLIEWKGMPSMQEEAVGISWHWGDREKEWVSISLGEQWHDQKDQGFVWVFRDTCSRKMTFAVSGGDTRTQGS